LNEMWHLLKSLKFPLSVAVSPIGDRRQETGDRNIDFPLPPASCFLSPSNSEK